MTSFALLALLLFSKVPQGRVCATSLNSDFHICGAWQLLPKAQEMRDAQSFEYGAWMEFEVEVR